MKFATDAAGAECLAAGLVPQHLKDQAREMLSLTEERKQIPA